MTLLSFQLKALRYTYPVDLANPESVRKLVIWLENLKIREYKIEDRKALADTQSPTWDVAFRKYLHDLQCPVPPSDLMAALHWLLAFATNLEYEDNADKVAPAAGPPAGAVPPGGAASRPGPPSSSTAPVAAGPSTPHHQRADEEVFTDLHDPRVVAAVRHLVAAAQVASGLQQDGGGGGSLVDQLMAAAQRCLAEVGPALRPGVWQPGRPLRGALAGVPLGFEVEGEPLCSAATALRLLYIIDLRRLQSQIDHAVVELQEYTANPKTDASLGKVGR